MGYSSEDSDDDLLSSAPIFTKKQKKEKASEKRAFNYLDNMLKKSEKRTEQQSRIQSLKEKETDINDEESHVEFDGGVVEENGEGRKASVRGRGGTYDDGGDHKIKLEGSGDDVRIGNVNDIPGEETNKAVKKTRSLSSNNSSSSLSSLPTTTRKKIKIDNDEYWLKLESLNKNPSSSVIERDRRRQNLRDAIDGLDVLRHISHDHNGDDINGQRGGHSENIVSVEDRELRLASMGLVTGKSSLVGTRCLFDVSYSAATPTIDEDAYDCTKQSQPGFFSLFHDLQQCMQALETVIKMMDKAAPRSATVSTKKMWNHVRVRIIDPIKKAKKIGLLPELLEKGSIWREKTALNDKVDDDDDDDSSIIVPFGLVRWLIRTSLSGKTVGTQLCIGAHEMACKILKRNNVRIMSATMETWEGFSDNKGFIHHPIFHIGDFVSILQSEFGLWTKKGCPPLPQCEKEFNNITANRSFGNEFGLKHAFELWTLALDNDFVTCNGDFSVSFSKDSWDCKGDCICSITAQLVATLLRSGLDQSFHSGYRLRKPQGQLLNSTFDWMKRRFTSEHNDSDYFQKWIEHAAEVSLQSCSNLSSNVIPNGEINCDSEGWLPLMLAMQTYQIVDQTNETVLVFFGCFACRAAQFCMEGIVQNWDSKLRENITALIGDIAKESEEECSVPKPPTSTELRMKCILSSETILDAIEQVGEKVTRDGPRFLAAVDLALQCEKIGMALFKVHAKNSENCVGIYESKAEAAAMCNHYERLENLSTVVKKQVVSVLVDKNMMRVKELLSLIGGFFRHCQSNARMLSNKRESGFFKKQQTMDLFVNGNSPDF